MIKAPFDYTRNHLVIKKELRTAEENETNLMLDVLSYVAKDDTLPHTDEAMAIWLIVKNAKGAL